MTQGSTEAPTVAAYWDARAVLGGRAGTDDLIAKQLEIEAIAKYVKDGMRVLDAGCGNGYTAVELAKRFDVFVQGIDTSPEMVKEAVRWAEENADAMKGGVAFCEGDVLEPPLGPFDLIYTERTLINLLDWETQRRAILGLIDALNYWPHLSGGLFVMCENSQDGLWSVNEMRSCVGLSTIIPPSHNRYIRDEEIAEIAEMVTAQDDGTAPSLLVSTDDYSGTYYFLSRVVNAAVAAWEGREPGYESRINYLATILPALPIRGQGRIWVWRR